MNESNPSPDTQAANAEGEGKVDSSVGSPTPSVIEVEKLGEVFGTKFSDTDTALKSVKELISKVGDQTIAEQRKAAERYTKISTTLLPEALNNGFSTADEYVEYLLAQGTETKKLDPETYRERVVEQQQTAQEKRELEDLKLTVEKFKIEKELGDGALKYYDAIKSYARSNNISDFKEAYKKSGFQDLVEADRVKSGTSIIENSRVGQAKSLDYERDLQEAQRTKDWTPFLAKHKGFEIPK